MYRKRRVHDSLFVAYGAFIVAIMFALVFDATAQEGYSISGKVDWMWAHIPMSGVTVSAMPGTASWGSRTATTDSNGEYRIEGLELNRSYTVTPMKEGCLLFEPRQIDVGGTQTSVDFVGLCSITIGGRVSGPGGQGARVTLTPEQGAPPFADSEAEIADDSGNYIFIEGYPFVEYWVEPMKTGYTFSPVKVQVGSPGDNITGVNFTSTASAGPPDAPIIGTVNPGDARAIVSFSPPASDGGSPITSYVVSSDVGNKTATGTTSPITITGLTNGTTYRFKVQAANAAGTGPASALSDQVTPVGLPAPPKISSVKAGNAEVQVTFLPSPSDGGSPITSYTVTSKPGQKKATDKTSPITVTGLTNGTAYTFTVVATNAIGTGPASGPSAGATPALPPGAPTNVTATPRNGAATVSFSPPASNGGSPITSYEVYNLTGRRVATGQASPITVIGLTNGTTYTFKVTAVNAVGTGSASKPSNPVTPQPR